MVSKIRYKKGRVIGRIDWTFLAGICICGLRLSFPLEHSRPRFSPVSLRPPGLQRTVACQCFCH